MCINMFPLVFLSALTLVNSSTIELYTISPPPSGRLFLHIGDSTLERPPSFIFLYSIGSILQKAHTAHIDCISIASQIALKSDQRLRFNLNNTCVLTNKLINITSEFYTSIHSSVQLFKPTQTNESWMNFKFEPIPNTQNSAFINEKFAFWHVTNKILQDLAEIKTISTFIQENFQNNTIHNLSDVDFDGLHSITDYICSSTINIILTLKSIIHQGHINLNSAPNVIHSALTYYLKTFYNLLSLPNINSHMHWKIKRYFIQQGILAIEYKIPFRINKQVFKTFLPIPTPLKIAGHYFLINNSLLNDSEIILSQNETNFSVAYLSELINNNNKQSNKYSLYPHKLTSKSNISCNFDIYRENIAEAENLCKLRGLHEFEAYMLIQIGAQNYYFFSAPTKQTLKYKCKNHVIKQKPLIGMGFVSLHKNCDLTDTADFILSTISIPNLVPQLPSFKISILTHFYTENFILRSIPNNLKDKFLIERFKLNITTYSIIENIMDIISKHHTTLLKINVIMFVALAIIIVIKINKLNKIVTPPHNVDSNVHYYRRYRPCSSLYRAKSVPNFDIDSIGDVSPLQLDTSPMGSQKRQLYTFFESPPQQLNRDRTANPPRPVTPNSDFIKTTHTTVTLASTPSPPTRPHLPTILENGQISEN